MNPLKRLKLKSMLRNCDYLLAGTVIKQQYYDANRKIEVNQLIDQFMEEPGFERALKLIGFNDMMVFYFTESCKGGLYVRKTEQMTEMIEQQSERQYAYEQTDRLQQTARQYKKFSYSAPEGVSSDTAIYTTKPNVFKSSAISNEDKEKLRYLQQIKESEEWMDEMISKKPKPASFVDSSDNYLEVSNDSFTEPQSDPKSSASIYQKTQEDQEQVFAVIHEQGGTANQEDTFDTDHEESKHHTADKPANNTAAEFSRKSFSNTFEETQDFNYNKPQGDGSPQIEFTAAPEIAATNSISTARPATYAPSFHEANRSSAPAPSLQHTARPSINNKEDNNHEEAASSVLPPRPETPVVIQRSYPNVIATLQIDLHTLTKQLEEYKRNRYSHALSEKQLSATIMSFEEAIREFSDAIELLES